MAILTRLDSSGEAKLRSSTLTFTVRTPENKIIDNTHSLAKVSYTRHNNDIHLKYMLANNCAGVL